MQIKPYEIHIQDFILEDLKQRIRNTRWPKLPAAKDIGRRSDVHALEALMKEWSENYDWKKQERTLNKFKHFQGKIDDIHFHFLHEPAKNGNGIPLILTHGWPSTFLEFLPLIPILTEPTAYDIEGPAFDVVVPSIPRYSISEKKAQPNIRTISKIWHRIMDSLGYRKYGAGGSDFGAAVSTHMALENPSYVIGLHLSTMDVWPNVQSNSKPLTEGEQSYIKIVRDWEQFERHKFESLADQMRTFGNAVHDSPVGLASWIVEKWYSSEGLDYRSFSIFQTEHILNNLTWLWVTNSTTSSLRGMTHERWSQSNLDPNDWVGTPTGFAFIENSLVRKEMPPMEWACRLYNVSRWTSISSGRNFDIHEGHLALAREIVLHFNSILKMQEKNAQFLKTFEAAPLLHLRRDF